MTPRGRPPRPVEDKLREGNAGNRKLPEPLKLPSGGALVKPDDFPPHASELWDDLVPILAAGDVLNRVDRPALEALCLQWERAVVARQVLDREGYFSLGSTGQTVEHPALSIERQAHTLFLRFASEFGITPVARARIAAARHLGGKPKDELDEVLELEAEEVEVT